MDISSTYPRGSKVSLERLLIDRISPMPIEQARPSPPFETKNRSKVFNGEIQTNQIKSKIKPKQIKSNKPGLLLHLRQKILRLLKGLQRLTVKVKQNDKTRSLDPKSTESPRRGKSASRLNLTRSNFKERAAQKNNYHKH